MNWEGFERVYGDESWENFKKSFPGADFSQFKEVNGNIVFKPTGEVLYRKGDLQEKTLKSHSYTATTIPRGLRRDFPRISLIHPTARRWVF